MTNAFLRTTLSLIAITLVGIVIYFGILSDASLPDHRWLHALAFFALSLPVLILWPRLMSVIGLTGLAVAVEAAQLWIPAAILARMIYWQAS